jgi:drug/metabolite transporter (DMT)-like permease
MKKAFIQLHIAVLLAGFTGILGRLITLNEGLLVWYRLMITAVTLWLMAAFRKKKQFVSLKSIGKIFGVGCIAALHWVCFYGSIKYANVSIALICFSAIGFFTALFEPLLFKSNFNLREILLGLLAVCGICFIFHFDPAFKTGIIIGVISSLLGSLFPILNKKLLASIGAETIILYELSGGFLFLTILLPFYLKIFPPDHILPTIDDLLWLLVLGWLCTVLAFTLSMQALKKISAFTVNLSYNLEPLYGIFLAFIIYREDRSFNNGFYIGFFLIILSVFLQSWQVYRSMKKTRLFS